MNISLNWIVIFTEDSRLGSPQQEAKPVVFLVDFVVIFLIVMLGFTGAFILEG